jgi:hypothetical protein
MIALLLAAISSSTGAPGLPAPASDGCMAVDERCDNDEDRRFRLTLRSETRYDSKMDAYRLDARPCRLIGDTRCPTKTREVWRSGESIRNTLARSFGLR